MFRAILTRRTLVILHILAYLVAGAASAQHATQEDVRQFIAAGDITGIEAALASQKAAVADGDVTQDEQRETFLAFSTTDPKMHAFVSDWLRQRPNSIYALTAQTWVNYNIAWFLRGEGLASDTYPDAMRGFSYLTSEALQTALQANSLDKGFVPASDAILRLGMLKSLPRPYEEYLSEIMAISPNYGSLHRGFASTTPSWGGRWAQAVQMCELYAHMITKYDDYTPHICKLDAALSAYHNDEVLPLLVQDLDMLGHPEIKRHRVRVAIYLLKGNKTLDAMARAQIAEDDFVDVDLAQHYDTWIASKRGWPEEAHNVYLRAASKAKAKLVHDPYNPNLLKTLARLSAGQTVVIHRSDYDQRAEYLRRSLYFRAYDADVWYDLHDMEAMNWDPEQPLAGVDMLNNAIVYSRHNVEQLRKAMQFYFSYIHLRDHMSKPVKGVPKNKREKFLNSAFGRSPIEDVICPFIRAQRVWIEVCDNGPGHYMCELQPDHNAAYQAVIERANSAKMCLAERSGPIESLFYTPVQVDLGF